MLANFINHIEYKFDHDAPEPESEDNERCRKLASERFPDFGFYNVALDITKKVGESETGVGDAIDDIADIYRDISEVVWLVDRGYDDAALFHLENSYKTHWGMHCRSLQLYMHAKENGI